mmetsp:Transcript_9565/g.10524  ORF Transcript_9565/g.10524 Transcript_9565/m.10524 type:complete len:265 (+) Transcript_9565:158-952(+)
MSKIHIFIALFALLAVVDTVSARRLSSFLNNNRTPGKAGDDAMMEMLSRPEMEIPRAGKNDKRGSVYDGFWISPGEMAEMTKTGKVTFLDGSVYTVTGEMLEKPNEEFYMVSDNHEMNMLEDGDEILPPGGDMDALPNPGEEEDEEEEEDLDYADIPNHVDNSPAYGKVTDPNTQIANERERLALDDDTPCDKRCEHLLNNAQALNNAIVKGIATSYLDELEGLSEYCTKSTDSCDASEFVCDCKPFKDAVETEKRQGEADTSP